MLHLKNYHNEKWNSIKEATESYTNRNISKVCNNESKSYKGYIWRYV